MACNECKNNATTFVNGFRDSIKKDSLNIPKWKKSRKEEAEWLETDEAKSLMNKTSLNFSEKVLLSVFCFFPLIVGYVTLIYLLIRVIV